MTTAKTRWDRDVLSRLRAADNVGDGVAVVRLLSTTPLEFPALAYDERLGRPYRHVYGVGTPGSVTTSCEW